MRIWFDRLGSVSLACMVWVGGITCTAESNGTATTSDHIATARLLPGDTVAWVHVDNIADAVDVIWTHPLVDRAKRLPAYQNLVGGGALGPLQAGVSMFEAGMQRSWQDAIGTISDGGITIALNETGGAAMLMRSSSEDALTQFRQLLISVARLSDDDNKTARAKYRDIDAWAIGDDLRLAQLGPVLLVTNQSKLGKDVINRFLDHAGETLADVEAFVSALALIEKQSTVHDLRLAKGYLDLDAIRRMGVAKDVFNERVDNFVGELVLGGILANTRQTPFATAQISLDTGGIELQFATPHERQWEPPREYYFGEGDLAAAPLLIDIKKRLFAFSTHRDLSQMWLRSGDLLSDRAADELVKADTQLSTFFSGRDFGEDILGSLHSDIQVVGRQQELTGVIPKPAIELPEFAIQFRMKSPEATQRDFRRVFQSFIGFLNVVGAMNGQPQFDQDIQKFDTPLGEANVLTATYVPDQDEADSTSASIHFNFSPTMAFVGDRVLLASTTRLARDLVSSEPAGGKNPDPANTQLMLDVDSLQSILKSNKDQLVANNMLEKGSTKKAAEIEIGLLMELVGFFNDASVRLDVDQSRLLLKANVTVDQSGDVDE